MAAFLAVLVMAVTPFVAPAVTYYWVGGSGNWSDSSNWKNGSTNRTGDGCPSSSDGVQINVNSEALTITVDADVSIASFGFVKTTSLAPSVTLLGSGTIAVRGNAAVNDFRSVVFDGPTVTVGNTLYLRGDVVFKSGTISGNVITVEMQGGSYGNVSVEGACVSSTSTSTASAPSVAAGTSFALRSGTMHVGSEMVVSGDMSVSGGELDADAVTVKSAGAFAISGGRATVATHAIKSGASFAMSGGRYAVTESNKTDDSAAVSITGGEFVADNVSWDDARYFGSAGSVFTITTNSIYALPVFTASGQIVDVAGSLIATNAGGNLVGLAVQAYGDLRIGGRGTMRLCQMNYYPSAGAGPMYVDLSELSIGNNLAVRGDMHLLGDMRIGAFADWVRSGAYTHTLYLHDAFTIDTCDVFDGATARTIALGTVFPYPGTSLSVIGGGLVSMGMAVHAERLDSVSVSGGATLSVQNTGLNVGSLSLASGATLNLPANCRVSVDSASISPGASVVCAVPSGDGIYPVITCASAEDAAAVAAVTTLSGDGAEGASLIALGSSVAAVAGDRVVQYPTNEWIGAVDGNWDTAGNWSGDTAPNSYGDAYFGGTRNTSVANVPTLTLERIRFLPSCGPFDLTGEGVIKLHNNVYTQNGALVSDSRFPVRVETQMAHIGTTFGIVASGGSFIEMAGMAYGGKRVTISGDVRVSGSLQSGWLEFYPPYGEATASRLTVLPGGTASFTNQIPDRLSRAGVLDVRSGGTLSMSGTNRWSSVENIHSVDGTLVLAGVLQLAANQSFIGTGTVTVERAASDADGSAQLTIGGGLRLSPGAWETVSADAPANTLTIRAETSATLASAADWTYGPAAEAETATTAETRAFRIEADATLTVDTGDLDDPSVGHVAKFADPVIGRKGASLVKIGAGTLVFASAGNAIAGGVAVRGGAIGWSCDGVALESLTLSPGTALAPPVKSVGGFATLTVSNSVDIAGVSLKAFDPAAKAAARDGMSAWLTVPAGCHITGEPNGRGWKWSVLSSDSGETLMVQYCGGFSLTIR